MRRSKEATVARRERLFVLEGLERRLLLSADPVFGVMAEGLLDGVDADPLADFEADVEAADFLSFAPAQELFLGSLDVDDVTVVDALPAIEVLGVAADTFEQIGLLDALQAPEAVEAPDAIGAEPLGLQEALPAHELDSVETFAFDADSGALTLVTEEPSADVVEAPTVVFEQADQAELVEAEPDFMIVELGNAEDLELAQHADAPDTQLDFALEGLTELQHAERADVSQTTNIELASSEADFTIERRTTDAYASEVASGGEHWGLVREAMVARKGVISIAADASPLAWDLLRL